MGCRDVALIALWRCERQRNRDRLARRATADVRQATSDRLAAPKPLASRRCGDVGLHRTRLAGRTDARPTSRWRVSNPTSVIDALKSSQTGYIPGWVDRSIEGLLTPARPRAAAFWPALGTRVSEPLRQTDGRPDAHGLDQPTQFASLGRALALVGPVRAGRGSFVFRSGNSRSRRPAASWVRGGNRRRLVRFAPARIASARRLLGTPRARAAAGASEQGIAPRSKEA